MIYVLHSASQKGALKREAKQITKNALNEINEFNYALFDAKEVPLREIVSACLEVPMLENKKVVVMDDAYFLTGAKGKDKINTDKDYQVLEKYITSPISETDLIILVYSDKLDSRGKLTKLLMEKANVKAISPMKPYEWEQYVSKTIEQKNINIDYLAKKELAKRTLNDRDRLLNELEKLSLYTDHIKYQDVTKMVTRKLEDNAFMLSNLLIEGKNVEAVNLFKDLKVDNIEPVVLISQLASQFRLLNQIRYLSRKEHLPQEEVAKQLKIKPGRVFVMSKSLSLISEQGILNALEELYNLDSEIKSGLVDRYYAFELFLLKFKRN